MKSAFLVVLFSLVVVAAKGQENIPTTKENNVNQESESGYLAVVSLKITKAENKHSVVLTNATILNTEKNFAEPAKDWHENDFVCFVLDEHKQVMDTLVIKQPLKARYEFPTDNKTIGSTTVDLKEKDVLLRFGYTLKMRFLSVARVGENKRLEKPELLTLPQIK